MVSRAKRTSENMAVALFAGIIIHLLYSLASDSAFNDTAVGIVISLVYAVLLQLVPAGVFVGMQKLSGYDRIRVEKQPSQSVRNNVLLSVAAFSLIFICGIIYSAAFPSAVTYKNESLVSGLLFITRSAVIPAVLEEFLYRHIFCRELTVYGNVFAIIGSSLLFALVHYSYYTFPYAFVCGLILGFVYIKTSSVKYTVGIHFMNNFCSYIFSLFSSELLYGDYIRIVVIAAVLFMMLALMALRMLPPDIRNKFPSKEYGNVPSSVFLTFPMGIFIVCAVILNFL